MIFLRTFLKLLCLFLLCVTQTGCGLLELPFDLLGSAVSTAVSAGVAAAPYAAPFFM
jgi:hypothetical protein